MKNNVKFKWIGFSDKAIPKKINDLLINTMKLTSNNTGTSINIFMNYSGRADIVNAARSFKQNETITEELFNDRLLTNGLPDVDLLIRTSGEQRISNFMLWQISYAEFVFSDLKWPEFTTKDLIDCVKVYNTRKRRFGGL